MLNITEFILWMIFNTLLRFKIVFFFFQKAHIPQSIMDVIQGKVPCDMHDEFDIVSKDACI